jgi:hypothetical protein
LESGSSISQPHEAERLVDPLALLLLGHSTHGKAEGDVAPDGQVREQGVALEDHAEAPSLRRQAVDPPAVEPDLAVAQG